MQYQDRYFADPYNYIDLISGALALWALVSLLSNGDEYRIEGALQALAGLLRWVKVIYFLRGFRSTAPLINMLQKIVLGMRSFAVVLAVVLIS